MIREFKNGRIQIVPQRVGSIKPLHDLFISEGYELVEDELQTFYRKGNSMFLIEADDIDAYAARKCIKLQPIL